MAERQSKNRTYFLHYFITEQAGFSQMLEEVSKLLEAYVQAILNSDS